MDYFQTFDFPAFHPRPSYSGTPKLNYDERLLPTVYLRFLGGGSWNLGNFVPSTEEQVPCNRSPPPGQWSPLQPAHVHQDPQFAEHGNRSDPSKNSRPFTNREVQTVDTKPAPCSWRTGNAGRKRLRTTFTGHQLSVMEKHFELNQYIGSSERKGISESLGLTEGQVKIWWQNRRIKQRKSAQKPGRSFALE